MRRKINLILGSLIALLSGCKAPQKTVQQQEVIALYGVPYATYDVSGKVVDQKKKPIADAKVVVKGYQHHAISDTLRTDDKGHFSTTISDFPTDTIWVVAEDQHTQATDSTEHKTSYQKKNAERGFYSGECEIKTTITLKH